MRVLHLSHQYPPAIGGSELYIAQLSEELARRGHSVDVFTSRSTDYRTWRSALPQFDVVNGVNVHRFSSIERTPRLWRLMARGYEGTRRDRAGARKRLHEVMIWLGSGPLMPGMARALWQRAGRYDLIHINNLHYSHAALGAWAARRAKRPYIVTPHIHPEQPDTYDVGYMRQMLQAADLLFADTEAEREFIHEVGLNHFVEVPGVALESAKFPPRDRATARAHFGLDEGDFVPLFLGRKTAYKGLEACVQAVHVLQKEGRRLSMLAVGPETEESAQIWERHPPGPGIIVRDRISDEERLLALAACDVLMLPSAGEAFGIVYLEAWQYEKPIIGGDLASSRSFITDGQEGFLVPPLDDAAVQARLAWLMDHPEEKWRMGRAGKQLLKRRFTLERIGDVVEGSYRRILRHAGRAKERST